MPTPPRTSWRSRASWCLRSWGKIEGEVRIGESARGRPARSRIQPDSVAAREPDLRPRPTATTTVTDDRGRFAFDRVVPGRGTAWREPSRPAARAPEYRRGAGRCPSRSSPARRRGCGSAAGAGPWSAASSSTAQPETPVDWTRNQPVEIHDRPRSAGLSSPRISTRTAGSGSRTSRPARTCSSAVVTAPHPHPVRVGTPIALVQEGFVVPEAPPAGPTSRSSWADHGQSLPDAQGRRTGPGLQRRAARGQGKGDRLQLGDERGKLVLIDFWASGAGAIRPPKSPPSRTSRRPSAATRGSGSSASGATRTSEPARRAIRENGLIWTHGFAGVSGSSVTAQLQAQRDPGDVPDRPGRPDPGEGPARGRPEGGDRQGPRIGCRSRGKITMSGLSIGSSAIAGDSPGDVPSCGGERTRRAAIRPPSRNRNVVQTLIAGGVLSVLVAGLGATRAAAQRVANVPEPPPAKQRSRPADRITGTVVFPDGTPAEKVEVVLGTRRNRISLQAGRIAGGPGSRASTPDPTAGSRCPPADDDDSS